MAEYHLSKIPYLDRHPLAYTFETSLFLTNEVIAAQYELAKSTNMYDYTLSLFELERSFW